MQRIMPNQGDGEIGGCVAEGAAMTIADICQAWYRSSCVHGEMPSTHTVTRKFREGDRTPEVISHTLLKFEPYLQRYANRFFPDRPEETAQAYFDLVYAVMKHPYIFNRDFGRTLRSFMFQCYRHKLLDLLKKEGRLTDRARLAGEHMLILLALRKSKDEIAAERCAGLAHQVFISGADADRARLYGITETDRSTWFAYWEKGMTEKELAKALNMSVNAISARIIKVKTYLRKQTHERLDA